MILGHLSSGLAGLAEFIANTLAALLRQAKRESIPTRTRLIFPRGAYTKCSDDLPWPSVVNTEINPQIVQHLLW